VAREITDRQLEVLYSGWQQAVSRKDEVRARELREMFLALRDRQAQERADPGEEAGQ